MVPFLLHHTPAPPRHVQLRPLRAALRRARPRPRPTRSTAVAAVRYAAPPKLTVATAMCYACRLDPCACRPRARHPRVLVVYGPVPTAALACRAPSSLRDLRLRAHARLLKSGLVVSPVLRCEQPWHVALLVPHRDRTAMACCRRARVPTPEPSSPLDTVARRRLRACADRRLRARPDCRSCSPATYHG